jgi:hypothetical protein
LARRAGISGWRLRIAARGIDGGVNGHGRRQACGDRALFGHQYHGGGDDIGGTSTSALGDGKKKTAKSGNAR